MRRDYMSPGSARTLPGTGSEAVTQGLFNLSQSVESQRRSTEELRKRAKAPEAEIIAANLGDSLVRLTDDLIQGAKENYATANIADLQLASFESGLGPIREEIGKIEDPEIRKMVDDRVRSFTLNQRSRLSREAYNYERSGILERNTSNLNKLLTRITNSVRDHSFADDDDQILYLQETMARLEGLKESQLSDSHRNMIDQRAADLLLDLSGRPDITDQTAEWALEGLVEIDPSRNWEGVKDKVMRDRAKRREAAIDKMVSDLSSKLPKLLDIPQIRGNPDSSQVRKILEEQVGDFSEHPKIQEKLDELEARHAEIYEREIQDPKKRGVLAMNHPQTRPHIERHRAMMQQAIDLQMEAEESLDDPDLYEELMARSAQARDAALEEYSAVRDIAAGVLEQAGAPMDDRMTFIIEPLIPQIQAYLDRGSVREARIGIENLIQTSRDLNLSSTELAKALSTRMEDTDPGLALLLDMMGHNHRNPQYDQVVRALQSLRGQSSGSTSRRIRATVRNGDKLIEAADRELLDDNYFQYLMNHDQNMAETYREVLFETALDASGTEGTRFLEEFRNFQNALGQNTSVVLNLNGRWLRLPPVEQQDSSLFEILERPNGHADLQESLQEGIETVLFRNLETRWARFFNWAGDSLEDLVDTSPQLSPLVRIRERTTSPSGSRLTRGLRIDYSKIEIPKSFTEGEDPLWDRLIEQARQAVPGSMDYKTHFLHQQIVEDRNLIFDWDGENIAVFWGSRDYDPNRDDGMIGVETKTYDRIPVIYDGEPLTFSWQELYSVGNFTRNLRRSDMINTLEKLEPIYEGIMDSIEAGHFSRPPGDAPPYYY